MFPLARQVHPLGRFCLALGLFGSLLMVHRDIYQMLTVFAACLILLRCMGAVWQVMLRAARLLLWFVIPVLLLHLIFTPGELLWLDSPISFSREGLQEGIWLSVRLCALFFTAMLLSRSLTREEWTYYCLRFPVLGPRLMPYVKLSAPMRALVSRSVVEAKSAMHAGAGWRDTTGMLRILGALTARVWHGSRIEAECVWQNWDADGLPRKPQGGRMTGAIFAVGGMLLPLAAWMN